MRKVQARTREVLIEEAMGTALSALTAKDARGLLVAAVGGDRLVYSV
jgi:hypothetical protein